MNFFRISRQIPENSDAFCFFNQICENKLESCRKFWNLAKQAACPPPQQALRRRLEKGCLRICVKMLGFLFGKYRVRGIHWLKLRDRYFVVEQSRNHGADYGGGSGDRHTHGWCVEVRAADLLDLLNIGDERRNRGDIRFCRFWERARGIGSWWKMRSFLLLNESADSVFNWRRRYIYIYMDR